MTKLSSFLLLFTTFALSFLTSFTPVSALNTNDFSFSASVFDYHLSQNPDGTSHLRVEETLTAEFPTYDQNHGITRCLPKKYRGVKTLDPGSVTVGRLAGSADSSATFALEPFSTYEEDGLFCLRIGSADTYVHGTNTYRLTYSLNNVILSPNNSPNQELYWDTNGTAWFQPFHSLVATVHLDPALISAFSGNVSCYVGEYGASGSSATSRCETSISSDRSTVTFTALPAFSDADVPALFAGENLTLDLEFSPDTFVVKKDLTPYIIGIFSAGTVALFTVLSHRANSRLKARNQEKIALDSGPKPVQYIPPKNLTVAEANTLWLHSTPGLGTEVANLMELAVTHRIQLEKAKSDSKLFKSTVWKIHVKRLSGATDDQKLVLQILNHGSPVSDGDIIELKNQSYSSAAARLYASYSKILTSSLESKHLFAKKSEQKSEPFATRYKNFERRTLKGVETSVYLDGLKEYIKLSEQERIKFLHSVPTADVSNQGIVNLYEKLLPYAIIFRCEDTWLKEMEKYYRLPDVSDPTWTARGVYLGASDFRAFRSAASSSVASATATASSGSSGGGGGGFSGGGGGGGGGGGW